MELRDSIQKSKNLCRRTLQRLRSFCLRRYQQLPKQLLCNLFTCSGSRTEGHQTDHHFYDDFCSKWDFDVGSMRTEVDAFLPSKAPVEDQASCSGGCTQINLKQSPVEEVDEKGGQEKKMITGSLGPVDGESKRKQNKKQGNNALAKKMKELEMMDVGDMEHVLDVEEALHYYSRLKSPVYLDIVDSFFTDIYSDFSTPQASVSINNSKRRLRSIRLKDSH